MSQKQMSKGLIITLCVIGFLVMFVGGMFLSGVGVYNGAVRMEKGVVAQYEQNQNNLSQYSNKIGEMVQIPTMYKDDFKEVLTGALQGRYGKDGSKATFQFLKEHEINFDSSLYAKIQTVIEAGRNHFEADQKTLIDKKRQYETKLDTFPGNIVLGALGFPKINLADYKILKSEYAADAFKKGVESGLKLR